MIFRAAWLLPIVEDPIRDAWVAVEKGRIVSSGTESVPAVLDLGNVVVLPALVNAHVHLELSYLRGAIPPAKRFVDWIRPLIAARRQYPNPADPRILDSARRAIAEARASGTGLVGDVSNTLVTVRLLREAGMTARVFYELLGFNVTDGVGRVWEARAKIAEHRETQTPLRIALAPHAPYSVSPELFQAIRADIDGDSDHVSTVHLAESAEELDFVRHGVGPWRDLLEEMGAWNSAWTPHGGSPVEYLADLGFLDSRVLAVHGVQLTDDDVARLRSLGTTIVSCPRSNRHVGAGSPPLESFYAMGVPVAFGTDSLASVENLNIFAELAEARRIAPRVPAAQLIDSATRCGAQALGFGGDYGTIEPGKRAALIAVRLPGRVNDVEEYLVGGVEPDQVVWLDADLPLSGDRMIG
jgi:cytosine/adenosine deaminase-related metal-dependent hydrolase